MKFCRFLLRGMRGMDFLCVFTRKRMEDEMSYALAPSRAWRIKLLLVFAKGM